MKKNHYLIIFTRKKNKKQEAKETSLTNNSRAFLDSRSQLYLLSLIEYWDSDA